MNCGMRLVRCLLIIFNFILVVAGVGLIVAGVVMQIRMARVREYHSGKLDAPAILLIVIGIIVVSVSFLGWCGALRKNYRCVVTYGALLVMILVLEVVCAGLALHYGEDWRDLRDEDIKNSIDNYDDNKGKVDRLQRTVECCGYTSYTDYRRLNLPSSCCGSGKGSCTPASGDLYTSGCKEAHRECIKEVERIVGGMAIGISILVAFGIAFAFCLANAIRKEKGPTAAE